MAFQPAVPDSVTVSPMQPRQNGTPTPTAAAAHAPLQDTAMTAAAGTEIPSATAMHCAVV